MPRFPLHTRGKERERLHFNYGAFLLNKNIAQLLHYAARLKPPQPANTLLALHALLMHATRLVSVHACTMQIISSPHTACQHVARLARLPHALHQVSCTTQLGSSPPTACQHAACHIRSTNARSQIQIKDPLFVVSRAQSMVKKYVIS